jgi:hypothetical protein
VGTGVGGRKMGSSPLATAGSASPSNSTTACLAKRFFRNRLDPLKPRILNDGAFMCCSWKMPPSASPPPLSWKIPATALAPARADPADIASPTNPSATAARIADCCPTRAHQRARGRRAERQDRKPEVQSKEPAPGQCYNHDARGKRQRCGTPARLKLPFARLGLLVLVVDAHLLPAAPQPRHMGSSAVG